MAKNKKTSAYNPDVIINIVQELNDRLLRVESLSNIQSKMLNANILKLASLVEILTKKGDITEEEIDSRAKEILIEVRKQQEELEEKYESDVQNMMETDDIGHA